MTRQELKDLMPDITDEQISAVLAKHHEEINAKTKAAEDKFSAYKDKADKYDKEQADKLSEQEKYQKLMEEAAQIKAENTRLLNRTKVQEKFVKAGIKYPVSEKYIEAIRAPVREDRITGGIRLKDGTIIPVDDSIIVQKSLTVTRKVSSSSKFDIGTVNSAEMRIKIRDAKAYDHDFGGAVISLKYGIVTATADDGSETWEDVPLPPFYVDGGEAARNDILCEC